MVLIILGHPSGVQNQRQNCFRVNQVLGKSRRSWAARVPPAPSALLKLGGHGSQHRDLPPLPCFTNCGNPAAAKSVGHTFPKAFGHFVYLCHILAILTIF